MHSTWAIQAKKAQPLPRYAVGAHLLFVLILAPKM